jgi:hypothetical protein
VFKNVSPTEAFLKEEQHDSHKESEYAFVGRVAEVVNMFQRAWISLCVGSKNSKK